MLQALDNYTCPMSTQNLSVFVCGNAVNSVFDQNLQGNRCPLTVCVCLGSDPGITFSRIVRHSTTEIYIRPFIDISCVITATFYCAGFIPSVLSCYKQTRTIVEYTLKGPLICFFLFLSRALRLVHFVRPFCSTVGHSKLN